MSGVDFPNFPVDAAAAEIGRVLEKRASGLRQRQVELIRFWEANGWCVVAWPGTGCQTFIGEAAAAWLATQASLIDPSLLTAHELTEKVPAEKILISSPRLLIWEADSLPEKPDRIRSLTPREREVLGWLQKGKTVPETAVILDCAARTVEKHAQNLYRKLGIKGRAALILTRIN